MRRLSAAWHAWHARRPLRRRAVKSTGVLLALLLALYPRFWIIPEQVRRWRDPARLIDPDAPQLAALADEVRAATPAGAALADVQGVVDAVVYRRVPYAFDWEVWGVMEYIPTVAEVFAQGREDCDGRAVVGASLLRRLGYDAAIVCDLEHAWVVASDPHSGATVEGLGPGRGEKTVVSDRTGTRRQFSFGLIANALRGFAFGTRVFPPLREALILAALALASLQPRAALRRRVAGCGALALALVAMRLGGVAPAPVGDSVGWGAAILTLALGGITLLLWPGGAAPPVAPAPAAMAAAAARQVDA